MDVTPSRDFSTSLWQRLRHRKVVQWALVYVAVAWGLLQALGFVADAFGWPAATKQVATIVAVLGLAIVIALAWYHGDRGQQRGIASLTIALLGTAAFLSLVGGLMLFFRHSPAAGIVGILVAVLMVPSLLILAYRLLPRTRFGRRVLLAPPVAALAPRRPHGSEREA